MPTFWWLAPACGFAGTLAGMLIALYIKDKSRDIAKIEFTEQIKGVLALFKMELLRDLDAIYIRNNEHRLMKEAHDDRLDSFEDDIEILKARILKLEQKTHE